MAVKSQLKKLSFSRLSSRLMTENDDGEIPLILFVSFIIVAIFIASYFIGNNVVQRDTKVEINAFVCCPNSDECHNLTGISFDTENPEAIVTFINDLCNRKESK